MEPTELKTSESEGCRELLLKLKMVMSGSAKYNSRGSFFIPCWFMMEKGCSKGGQNAQCARIH